MKQTYNLYLSECFALKAEINFWRCPSECSPLYRMYPAILPGDQHINYDSMQEGGHITGQQNSICWNFYEPVNDMGGPINRHGLIAYWLQFVYEPVKSDKLFSDLGGCQIEHNGIYCNILKISEITLICQIILG